MALLINLRHLERDPLSLEGELSAEELEMLNLDELMHMTQPFPCRAQLAGGPAVPVVSMKTSPSKWTFSPAPFPLTATIRLPSMATSSMRVMRRRSTPLTRSALRTKGSMVATL